MCEQPSLHLLLMQFPISLLVILAIHNNNEYINVITPINIRHEIVIILERFIFNKSSPISKTALATSMPPNITKTNAEKIPKIAMKSV